MGIAISVHDNPVLQSIRHTNNSTGVEDIEREIQTLQLEKETLEYELKELAKQGSDSKNKAQEMARKEKRLVEINIKLNKLKLEKERKEKSKKAQKTRKKGYIGYQK